MKGAATRRKLTYLTAATLAVALLGLAFWLTLSATKPAEVAPDGIPARGVKVEVIAQNLNVPWALAFTSERRMLVAERGGRVLVIEDGELKEEPLATISVAAQDEGGLHGIAVDPEYAQNRHVYFYRTVTAAGRLINQVIRVNDQGDGLSDLTVILDNIPGANIHNGGRIAFGPDGFLYIATGDANQPHLAQDRSSLAGKILRVDRNGNPAPNNPFEGSPVYSLGHRNPQGLAWHPDGRLYASEHGPVARDEINLIEAGSNYGWPEVRGTAGSESFIDPVIESGNDTWAPAETAIITGNDWPLGWQDTLVFAGLRSQALWRLDLEGGTLEALFVRQYGRLRAVIQGPDGNLYFTTSNQDGRGNPDSSDDRIIRISPDR